MKTWEDMYDYVLPSVPGVSAELATLHIRNAAIEFCDETGIADYEESPIPLVAGQALYTVGEAGADYGVARIKSAYLDSQRLHSTTSDALDSINLNWREFTGTPFRYLHLDPTQIRLYPIPDKSEGTLSLTFTLRPTRESAGIDDFIFDRYVEVIAAGAIKRLASQPNKPWSNEKVAAVAGTEFARGKHDAVVEVNKSFTRTRLQVKLKRIM